MTGGISAAGSNKKYAWRSNPRSNKPKVKSGCRTCKARRIKCGEEKPHCFKCRSTGRQCDGYEDIPPIAKPKIVSDCTSIYDKLAIPAPYSGTPAHSLEIAALQFFQRQTVPQLRGFFDSELWSRYILQLSFLEPSLYYAVTALGALHRWFVIEEPGKPLDADYFVFRQYNKAIHHLVHPLRPLSKTVVLVSCYLFSSIEALYGDYISSFRHVSSGIKLLCDAAPTTATYTYPVETPICPNTSEEVQLEAKLLGHFSQLDLQAATFNPEWLPLMTKNLGGSDMPESFSTLEEAKRLLIPLMLQTMTYIRCGRRSKARTPHTLDIDQRTLLGHFLNWSAAMKRWLIENSKSPDEQQARRSAWLRILWETGYIMVSVPAAAEQCMYDDYIEHFQSIVDLVSSLGLSSEADDKTTSAIFSHEVGILPALYVTGTRCRDPVIRRRALSLLTSSRRREGVWDSRAAAKVVELVMTVEEHGIFVRDCVDVPEESRIRDTWLQAPSNASRRAPVVMTRWSTSQSEMETIVEIVDW